MNSVPTTSPWHERGAADHDQPYRFGRTPTSSQPFPFSTHQYARLLILRSRVQAGALPS